MLTYLQKKSGRSYEEAISQLQAGQYIPEYESLFLAKETYAPIPLDFGGFFEPTKNYPDAEKYLASRGISEYTVRKLGLEYDPDKKRIVFPVKDVDGNLFGFTGRVIEDHIKPKVFNYCDVDKSQFILGQEHWNRELPSVLVEGLFALAHFTEITKGKYFPYNLGAIMGSSISDGQIERLIKFGQPIYVFLDNDPPGRAGMYGKPPQKDWSKAKRELERSKGLIHKLKDDLPTFIPKWPEDISDPDKLSYDQLYDMILSSKLAF
jgi:hypothetical protein